MFSACTQSWLDGWTEKSFISKRAARRAERRYQSNAGALPKRGKEFAPSMSSGNLRKTLARFIFIVITSYDPCYRQNLFRLFLLPLLSDGKAASRRRHRFG